MMKLPLFQAGMILFPLLLLASTAFSQSPPEPVLTLDECLRQSVANSPHLRISSLEQNKLRYRYLETLGTGLPNVSFSGSFDDYVNLPTQMIPGEFFGKPGEMIPVQFGTTYNLAGMLDASQILYNQTFLVALRMARLAMEQNSLETERLKIEVVFETAQTFYFAQITRQQILNLENNLAKLERAGQIARSQYENGLIKKVDLDRILVNNLNIRTQIDRLKVLYEQQLNMERYYMGWALDDPLRLPDSIPGPAVDLLATEDLSRHIDIRMIGKQKQMAMTNLRLNQSAYYPALTLIGSTSYLNQSNTYYVLGKSTDWFNTSVVGVRLQVPVFNGLQRKYKVSQSRVELDQLRVTEDNTRRILQVQSRDAASKLVSAITDEQRQRENMRLAERVYAISQEQYQKGIISLTDLLNAESSLSDAQTNHSLALVQMKISELEYMKANGTLLGILEKK
jgi:outer membrane protein TolC